MKKTILIFLLLLSCVKPFEFVSHGATYYVMRPPIGDDDNDGSYLSPFATLTVAFTACSAGDTIYVRGGTYTYAEMGLILFSNRHGTAENPICVYNYPNEHPIIDYDDYTATGTTRAMRIENVSYVHIKGIEIKNLKQGASGTNNGIYVSTNCKYLTIENMNIHHIGGWGVVIVGGANTSATASDNVRILYCDSHHNSDRRSGWGGADGFLMNSYDGTSDGWPYPATNITYEGCRAWMNSDDGWDHRFYNGAVTIINCWAFQNGYQPGETDSDADVMTEGGNGYGFKLGSIHTAHSASVLRTMYNCVAYANRETGIQCEWSDRSSGGYSFSSLLYNNTAYYNGLAGFSCGAIVAPALTTLRNNISYGNGYDIVSNSATISDEYNASSSSSWARRDFIPTSSDFISLTSTGITGTRGEDGSLPVLNFLRLRDTSPLVDAGTDVGLDYNGYAPDLGAFEVGDEDDAVVPSVTTTDVTSITATTASSGGTVVDDGGESVTARGVCWSTAPNPTTANNHTSDGSGVGTFTSSLSGLESGDTYYVRAYATNSIGTAYGSNKIFTAGGTAVGGGGKIIMKDGMRVTVGAITKY